MKKNYLKVIDKDHYTTIIKKIVILFLDKYKYFFINKKLY